MTKEEIIFMLKWNDSKYVNPPIDRAFIGRWYNAYLDEWLTNEIYWINNGYVCNADTKNEGYLPWDKPEYWREL
jgi:hypothetical protein